MAYSHIADVINNCTYMLYQNVNQTIETYFAQSNATDNHQRIEDLLAIIPTFYDWEYWVLFIFDVID